MKVTFVADCIFINANYSEIASDKETALGVLNAIPELVENKTVWLRETDVLSEEQCEYILENISVFPDSTKFIFELDYESIAGLGDSETCASFKETEGITWVANVNNLDLQRDNLNLDWYGVSSISVDYEFYLSAEDSELFTRYDSFIHLDGHGLDAERFPDKVQLIATNNHAVNKGGGEFK